MTSKPAAVLVVLCLSLVSSPFLQAQVRVDNPGGESREPDVATGGDGQFVVVWREASGPGTEGVSGRRVGADGLLASDEFIVEIPESAVLVSRPSVAMDGSGRFIATWGEKRGLDSCAQGKRFAPNGAFLGSLQIGPCTNLGNPALTSVAAAAGGGFAVAWDALTASSSQSKAVFLRTYASSGEPLASPFQVSQALAPPLGGLSVAVDDAARPVVAWQNQPSSSVFRLFNASGQPRSGVLAALNLFDDPQVAADATGRFIVSGGQVLAHLFTADGQPYERPVIPGLGEIFPDFAGNTEVSMNSLGNFVMVWEVDNSDIVGGQKEVVAQAYNNRGALQTFQIHFLAPDGTAYTSPSVALQEDGTFLVVWESRPPGGPSRILSEILSVPVEDDLCYYRGAGELRCATLLNTRTFFNESQQLGNGRAAGDLPFLADVDGDGDDDPCVRRGASFLCDVDHDGDVELTLPFGSAEHKPLFGNLDGDADDDPCVRRGRTFLCDTAHDSGGAEIRILFGLAADQPLLGDVDGDGDDDPCVFRASASRFLCDLDHDGQRDFVLTLNNAQAGDRALMGDADGDGHDDFCVARGQSALCDLARTGTLAQWGGQQGAEYFLFGNIDGF